MKEWTLFRAAQWDSGLGEVERSALALFLIAEVFYPVTEGMGQRHQEAVVGLAAVVVGQPHLETGSSPKEKEGDITVCMGASLPELVGPHDGGVIEHGTLCPGFRNAVEFPGKVGDFPGEPLVNAQEFVLGFLVLDRLVGKMVMTLLNLQPAHTGLPHRAHILERAHATHVIGEGIDKEVDLHAADLRGVVVDQFNVGIEVRLRVYQFVLFPVPGEFTLHGPDQLEVIPEALPVFLADP